MATLVESIMTKDIQAVAPDAAVLQVLELMMKHSFRHVPVVEQDKLVGMISERDILMYCEPQGNGDMEVSNPRAHLGAPVTEIMSSTPVSVHPSDKVSLAIEKLLSLNIGALAVVEPDSNKLVGIVSYVDILQASQSLFDH